LDSGAIEEPMEGQPTSPYAATKKCNEVLACSLSLSGKPIAVVGLRYFNVYGQRQSTTGGYGAVIPVWIEHMLASRPCPINGDGKNTRDFVHDTDVARANILAASVARVGKPLVLNVGGGRAMTLLDLHATLAVAFEDVTGRQVSPPVMRGFREGDIEHSLASTKLAREVMGFDPSVDISYGLKDLVKSKI